MKKRMIVIIAAAATTIAAAGVGIYSLHLRGKAAQAVNVSQLSSGEQYLAELQYEKAIAAFEQVIEVEPNNAEAYLAMAKTYRCMGDVDAARETLEKGYGVTNSTVIERELGELLYENNTLSPLPETLDVPVIEVAGRIYPADITELVLRDCDLNDVDIEKLAGFTNLERLDISGNQISDLSTIGKLTTLKKFYAANNMIKDVSPLAGLVSLEYVGLRGNKIMDATSLFSLGNLKYLHLSNNQIKDVSGIGDSLQLLYLANNRLGRTDAKAIKNAGLLYYDISGNAGM